MLSKNTFNSVVRPKAIRAADSFFYQTGVRRVIGKRYGGVGSVLMWHSVVHRPSDYLNQDIRCSVAYLDAVLRTCRRHEIAVVDMDEALKRLMQPVAGRFVVMTFDDGYRDNVTAALPIFERYNLPLVVYPAVGLITRQAFYWWGGLVELLKRNDSVEIEGLGRFETRSLIEKRRSLAAINRWVEGDVTQRCEALRGAFETKRIDLPDLMARDTMSAEELKSLARHPLVSIGSHTFSHTYLRPLTDAIAGDEIVGSKKWLEDLTQQPVDHFSYPHGDARACGTREAKMVQRAGYRTAVSTRRGNLFPDHASAPFLLPRGAVNPHRETVASLMSQLSGIPRFLASRAGPQVDPDTTAVRS